MRYNIGSSEIINLSAINIPSIQFTNGEKGALAVAATLLVASQIFPQLSTSFGWVCECGPISMVLGVALAGSVVIRAHANHDSRMSALRAKLASQTEKANSLCKSKDDRISELKREMEGGLSAANERIEELEAELASQSKEANSLGKVKDDKISELKSEVVRLSAANARIEELDAKLASQTKEAKSLCKARDDEISKLNHEIETLTKRLADQAEHSSSESLGDQEALDESTLPLQEEVDDIHNTLDELKRAINAPQDPLYGDSPEEPEDSDEDEGGYYSAQEEISEG